MERLVSRTDLEAMLARIAQGTRDARAGIFGPASITWHINRESALFLGAGRAALLQLAHPWVAAALAEHSTLLHRPIARFHNTFRVVYTMLFGSLPQALAAARFLHMLHTRIGGELREAVGGWPEHARYEANEIAALRWVYATLLDSAVLAYEAVLPLTPNQREGYYQESKTFAALFGIPAAALPEDWKAFAAYTQQMFDSEWLGVSPAAREMARAILSGAGSRIHPPRWYRALTTAWLPPRLRGEFGLELTAADLRLLGRTLRWLPRVYPHLPPAIRFVGPSREGMGRLRNRGNGPLVHISNRFWIGQPQLPFDKEV